MPGDVLDGYVFEGDLGSGGMAFVLLARGPEGRRVALKVLRRSRFETGMARFRREFHALSRLDHPNVVRVYGYGDVQGHPYIAMEYIDGPDLHSVIRSFRDLDDTSRFARCEAILVDLCRALAAIHRRGLVHRDLKPSNILLTREGTCKLTDFGIVKELDPRRATELSTTLVGTWAYASPEHIGGDPVDHRADLYSLGVILFAMLTGKRPFAADGMAGYLEAHRNRAAPRASRVKPSVPAHLDEICARLLEKAPRDRFQSAREILYRLGAEDPDDPVDGSEAWEPTLVGDSEAIRIVEELVSGLTGGHGGVVRVVGDEGLGKSRVLQVAVDRARMLGLPFHLLHMEPEQPVYGVAIHLARELLASLEPGTAEGLATTVAAWHDGTALAGDARFVLYEGLRTALDQLLTERPRLLLVDDAHHARPAEADLLRYLARHLVGEDLPFGLVVTSRQGTEDEASSWTRGLEARTVHLGPLTPKDVAAMLAPLVGPGRHARALADRLHAETEGNPAFLVEFVRSLVAEGLVVRRDGAWHMTVDPAEVAAGHLEVPPSIRQILRARLDRVEDDDGDVVDALAIAGHAVAIDVLLEVLDLDEEALLRRTDRLLRGGLLREHRRADELTYALASSQLGELVLRELPDDRQRKLHGQLAQALAALGAQDPDTLARIGEHERDAGRPGRAFAHLVAAAARLVERSMPEEASPLSATASALELAAQSDLPGDRYAELRRQHTATRAEILRHRGAWAEAAEAYRELVALCAELRDERAGAEARIGLSHAVRRLGDHDEATRVAQEALATCRTLHFRKGVAEALQALAAVAWSEGDLEQCESYADEGLLITQGPALAAPRAHLLLGRSAVQATRGQLASAVRGMAEAEQLFDELKLKAPQVLALANLAELHAWQGETEEAFERASAAVELARGLGHLLGLAAGLRARGVACTDLGRFDEAHRDLQEAVDVARRLELDEEYLATAVALTRLALEQSDVLGAMRHAAEALDATHGRDPERYLPLMHAYLARALARRSTRAAWTMLQAVEDALPTLPEPRRLQVLLAAAWAWLALGDKARAIEHAQQLVRSPSARAFRLLNLEARMLLGATTSGEEAKRHRKIGSELAREFTENLPLQTSEEVRRRSMFRWFEDAT